MDTILDVEVYSISQQWNSRYVERYLRFTPQPGVEASVAKAAASPPDDTAHERSRLNGFVDSDSKDSMAVCAMFDLNSRFTPAARINLTSRKLFGDQRKQRIK